MSGWVLDNTTGGTGSTIQLQVLGMVQRVDAQLGAYARCGYLIDSEGNEWTPGVPWKEGDY